ncbi:gnat family [Diplodia corticola]|uniref:Gnat family n=1 Tax=Diplodia corticola TaxID=236234 RepID=A0A1J9RXE8_9PEZI|nr:gnat family [Diplodia corticola]OJD32508.1 gnat family [Diplodia corticola]
MPAATPHHTLHPVTPSDTPALMAVGAAAFEHDLLRLATWPALSPTAPPSAHAAEYEFRRRRQLKRLATPGVVMHKVLADDGTSVAGFSAWVAPKKSEDAAAQLQGGSTVAEAVNPGGEVPEGANRAIFEAQPRLMEEAKRRVLGERSDFWYLTSLATHPDHQGKGVGAALVRWGIEQGERDGVPVYLEATPDGYFLYKKLGFEQVDEIDVSELVPNCGSYKIVCMLKRPSSETQTQTQ